jgi:preprotein translocase subunit SecD
MKLTFKIWLLIAILLLSVLSIGPNFFAKGALVTSVDRQSTIFQEGLRAGDIVKSVNGNTINNAEDYGKIVSKLFANLGVNETVRLSIVTNKESYDLFSNDSQEISVGDIPKTRIQTGLDLRGGARALVKAENATLTDEQLTDLVDITRNKLNAFGLTDINVRPVRDLSGNGFMLIEIAGATPNDLKDLIGKQGKFEAKIANQTVFEGGKKDIQDVCRNDAKCSGITDCQKAQEGYQCQFRFVIYLNPEAAQRHADITKNVSLDETGRYLKDKLYLYVDGNEMDSLLISADLRGRTTTDISIEGPGVGRTQEEAMADAKANMKKLQTILLTGSLPYKLEIVKLDTISPTLGNEFVYWILIAGVSAIGLVGLIVFVRYRNIKASLAVLATSFSEIIVILGFATLIRWNLDLPSIAGILATIGTGVDQQIVILDESKTSINLSIGEKMKRALFIIFSAFATSSVSLLPLFSAGAGFFKGFAITTLVGIVAGVFITRPAFADMIKNIKH